MVFPSFPAEVRDVLGQITSLAYPAKQGLTSQVVFVEARHGAVVVKRSTGRHVAALRREHAVLTALGMSDLPVPAPLLFVEHPRSDGSEGWLLMNRLPGVPVVQALHGMADDAQSDALLAYLGRVLAQLHATPAPPQVVLPGPSWLDVMLQQAAINLATGVGEGSKADLDELLNQRPAPVPPVLIHGDLFLDNVLATGSQVTGLIDWAFGALGDPRYDLALAHYDLTPRRRQALVAGYGAAGQLTGAELAYFGRLAAFF